MNDFLKKLNFLLEKLSSKPRISGLQITDSAVHCVLLEKELRTLAIKVPPGVVREGKLQDPKAFSNLLLNLHQMIEPARRRAKVPVIVSLPAAVVYSQSFNVPNVGEDGLKESAELNAQMISPIPQETAYASWQKLAEFKDRYELLGAFSEKAIVDQYYDVLEDARFAPIAFEFPGLSLSRLIGQFMNAVDYSVLVFQISSDGLDLAVLRKGLIYFDYFHSWRSIQGESREISKNLFYEVVTQEVGRVVNFVQSKFRENISQVLLIAPSFEVEIQGFLEKQFSLRVIPLRFRSWPVQPNWYVALGAALRGRVDRSKDTSISIAPLSSVELFYQDQLADFVVLWRNIAVGVLLIFFLLYWGMASFLVNQSKTLEQRVGVFRVQGKEKDLAELEIKVKEFNRLVKGVAGVSGKAGEWHDLLQELIRLSGDYKVSLSRIDAPSVTGPITIVAQASDYAGVVNFKNILTKIPSFTDVNLVVPRVVNLESGAVLFTVTFGYKP